MSKTQYYTLKKGSDIVRISVTDGIVKTEFDKVSAPNHSTAEKFKLDIASLGKSTSIRRRETHTHTHNGQTHTH